MTFDRFRFCKGNIGGTPRNKEETPKGRSNRFFYPPPCRVPWHYGVSCNNRREMHKTILMPKHKMPLSILSPCVSVREYRGSARRARGLNTIVEQKYETPPPVVSRNITGYRLAIGGKNKHVTQESIILLPAVSRSITGCRPAIGGEEQTRYTGKYYPPPLPCPVALRGVLQCKI